MGVTQLSSHALAPKVNGHKATLKMSEYNTKSKTMWHIRTNDGLFLITNFIFVNICAYFYAIITINVTYYYIR